LTTAEATAEAGQAGRAGAKKIQNMRD